MTDSKDDAVNVLTAICLVTAIRAVVVSVARVVARDACSTICTHRFIDVTLTRRRRSKCWADFAFATKQCNVVVLLLLVH